MMGIEEAELTEVPSRFCAHSIVYVSEKRRVCNQLAQEPYLGKREMSEGILGMH